MDENKLIAAAKKYLKETYDEDTVTMTVTNNKVKNGTGILSVNCTVSVDGEESDWSKDFHFENGKVVDMDYWQK